MSAGVFTLVSNDGKQDCNIFATSLLKYSIDMYSRDKPNNLPKLCEIEKTHYLPYQFKFKPLIPVAMEYQKINATTQVNTFGQSLTFSLSQYGDFISDMVVHLAFSSTNTEPVTLDNSHFNFRGVQQVPGQLIDGSTGLLYKGDGDNGNLQSPDTKYVLQVQNDPFYQDPNEEVFNKYQVSGTSAQGNLRLTVQEVVYKGLFDKNLNQKFVGESVRDDVFYTDWPGERLFEDVSFEINGNKLDEYNQYSYVFNRQFKLKSDTLAGYMRSVGQQISKEAFNVSSYNLESQVVTQMYDGLQTPKQEQPAWDLWQKLLFWFNRHVQLALPSCAIPYGQRYIKMQLASKEKMVLSTASVFHAFDVVRRVYNLGDNSVEFVNADGTNQGTTIASHLGIVNNSLPAMFPNNTLPQDGIFPDSESTSVKRYYVPQKVGSVINYPTITEANIYANNIFTHSTLHDIYVNTVGYTLIRIHKTQQQSINTKETRVLLSNIKYPVEYMFIGILPDENTDTSNPNHGKDWNQFLKKQYYNYSRHGATGSSYNTFSLYDANAAAPVLDNVELRHELTGSSPDNGSTLIYSSHVSPINTLQVTAHGISLYPELQDNFYNSYLPQVASEQGCMVTPKDEGVLMFNFALQPGMLQPSGHFNVSRAREFFLEIKSDVVGEILPGSTRVQQGRLVTEACAINFLLVSDGSAVLRYST